MSYKWTTPAYKFLNSVGINPIDKIPYGTLQFQELGTTYIVRFDDTRIEFVGRINGTMNPIAGTFDAEGVYYFASFPENHIGHMMAIPKLDTVKGYDDWSHPYLKDYSDILQVRLGTTLQIADLVSIAYPDETGKVVSHIVGINRDQ